MHCMLSGAILSLQELRSQFYTLIVSKINLLGHLRDYCGFGSVRELKVSR